MPHGYGKPTQGFAGGCLLGALAVAGLIWWLGEAPRSAPAAAAAHEPARAASSGADARGGGDPLVPASGVADAPAVASEGGPPVGGELAVPTAAPPDPDSDGDSGPATAAVLGVEPVDGAMAGASAMAGDAVTAAEAMITTLDSGQWTALWLPFRSPVSARGFAARLTALTGLDYQVVPEGTARHRVHVRVEDGVSSEELLGFIAARTGLDVEAVR